MSEENDDSLGELEGIATDLQRALLGAKPTLTRSRVAEKGGMPLDLAEELWQQLGFPRTTEDDVAFTKVDVKALKITGGLIARGILEEDSQAALVRTWGRSFARLAEWQVSLLAGIALEGDDPQASLDELLNDVLPQVEWLQNYVWRRHLASAADRVIGAVVEGDDQPMAVVFVDIVGYTSQSKEMTEHDLVDWVDYFEDETSRLAIAVGGRVIKTIGDEVLLVIDDLWAAAEVALTLTERGHDADDRYPEVRAGLAWGPVTKRLGDVFGPTVNIASRLTSVARPGSVLIDRVAFEVLTEQEDPETAAQGISLATILDKAADELADLSPFAEHGEFRFRRMRRISVKGYRHLEPWVLRRAKVKQEPKGSDSDG